MAIKPLMPDFTSFSVELCPLAEKYFIQGIILPALVNLSQVELPSVMSCISMDLGKATAITCCFELEILCSWSLVDIEQHRHFVPELGRNQRRRRICAFLFCKYLIFLFFEEVQILYMQILRASMALFFWLVQTIELILNLNIGFHLWIFLVGYNTALIEVYFQGFYQQLFLVFVIAWSQRFEYHLLIFHLFFDISPRLLAILIFRDSSWKSSPWLSLRVGLAALLARSTVYRLLVSMVGLDNLFCAFFGHLDKLRQLSNSMQWELAFDMRLSSGDELLRWQTVVLSLVAHGSCVTESFWNAEMVAGGSCSLASSGLVSWCEVVLGRVWCLCRYWVCSGVSVIEFFVVHKHEVYIRIVMPCATSTTWSVVRTWS